MSDYQFNLQELIDELAKDDSWEEDPETRQGIAFALTMAIG